MPKVDVIQGGPLIRKANILQTYTSRGKRFSEIANGTGFRTLEYRVSELGRVEVIRDTGIQRHSVQRPSIRLCMKFRGHFFLSF